MKTRRLKTPEVQVRNCTTPTLPQMQACKQQANPTWCPNSTTGGGSQSVRAAKADTSGSISGSIHTATAAAAAHAAEGGIDSDGQSARHHAHKKSPGDTAHTRTYPRTHAHTQKSAAGVTHTHTRAHTHTHKAQPVSHTHVGADDQVRSRRRQGCEGRERQRGAGAGPVQHHAAHRTPQRSCIGGNVLRGVGQRVGKVCDTDPVREAAGGRGQHAVRGEVLGAPAPRARVSSPRGATTCAASSHLSGSHGRLQAHRRLSPAAAGQRSGATHAQ